MLKSSAEGIVFSIFLLIFWTNNILLNLEIFTKLIC